MKFGYARISTEEQNLDLQINALLEENIPEENIFVDKVSGTREEREELNLLFQKLRKGDILFVWKMDRMARSLIHYTKIVNKLREKEILFKSLTEPFLDTTVSNPHGKFLLNIFASLAEFEKDLIKERTKAGLAAARKKGKILGHPRGLSEKAKEKAILAEEYHKEGKLRVDKILKKLDISRGTYYKYLRYRKVEIKKNKQKGKK